MKFVLSDATEFDWPIKIKVPSSKRLGSWDTATVTCRFQTISKKRQDELEAELADLQSEAERTAKEIDLLDEVLIGWDENEMADEEGEDSNPVPFDADTKAQALANPFFRVAAFKGYVNAISGEARKGN